MSVKSKIQSLIAAANTATGESDATLTDAVQTLVDGYGQGGGGGDTPEDWMNKLPSTDGYIYAALKPLDRKAVINITESATVEYGEIVNGAFVQSGTISGNIVPPHGNALILRLSIASTMLGYRAFPPSYAVKDTVTTAFPNASSNSYLTPPCCDYFLATKNKSGSNAVSYTMQNGARKVKIAVSAFTFSNNVQLFLGSPIESIEMDNIKFSAKLDSGNGLKVVKFRNWTWAGSTAFNDGLVFMNATEIDVSGWSGTSSITNFNGLFSGCKNLVSLNLSGWDMSAATSFNAQFKNLYSLQNFVATGATLPSLNMDFSASILLTDESLVNIANALPSASKTLTLSADAKTRCAAIMGTVTNGVFTVDASGAVTLTNFITTTKGWTIA